MVVAAAEAAVGLALFIAIYRNRRTIDVNRINSPDKLEDATIDRKTMQYLYDSSGQGMGPFVFMDNQSFDQIEVESDVLPREQSQWLKENTEVLVTLFEGNPLGVEMLRS